MRTPWPTCRPCFLLLAIVTVGCSSVSTMETGGAPGASTPPVSARPSKSRTKVSPELVALSQSYRQAAARNVPFRSDDPRLLIEDGCVAIDAVAEQDGSKLRERLVGLGLRNAASFGRVVSGQLPIEAIPALEGVEGLAVVRAASARRGSRAAPEERAPPPRGAISRLDPVSGQLAAGDGTCIC